MTKHTPHTIEIAGASWPRRDSLPHQHIAEQAITEAVRQIEMIGASKQLSGLCSILIGARALLADELEQNFPQQLRPLEEMLPNLWRACQVLDEDSGAEHISRIEDGYIRPREARLRSTLRDHPTSFDVLVIWDQWLGTLDEEQLASAVCGEETEQQTIMARCPHAGLDEFICAYWEMN